MADAVTIPSRLSIPEVRTYMTIEAAGDLSAPDTPAPAAVDDRGRSAKPPSSTWSCAQAALNGALWREARTSTLSPRRSQWKRFAASSRDRPGRSVSPPPASSSTRPTSSARCPRTSPLNCVSSGQTAYAVRRLRATRRWTGVGPGGRSEPPRCAANARGHTPPNLVLGYAHLAPPDIARGVRLLAQAQRDTRGRDIDGSRGPVFI